MKSGVLISFFIHKKSSSSLGPKHISEFTNTYTWNLPTLDRVRSKRWVGANRAAVGIPFGFDARSNERGGTGLG